MPSDTTRDLKVLVLGFGALGALYGFLLSRGGAKVYAVARSNADSLRQRGIDIRSQKYGNHPGYKPDGVVTNGEEARDAGPFDFILCTVKLVPEQKKIGEWIAEFLPESDASRSQQSLPTVVFVENGIGIEEEPYETLCANPQPKASTIISCCAWLGATLVDGGLAVSHGPLERLEMGLYPAINPGEEEEQAWRRKKLDLFSETYKSGGGGAEAIYGDIQPKRWTKLLWNAAWGGLTTVARQPVAEMLRPENLPYTANATRKIMLEILYVARACGYGEDVLPAQCVDQVFELTHSQAPSNLPEGLEANLPPNFKPSLLVDLEAHRPMELSPIIGNVLRKAQQHNIDTPRLDIIHAALHPSLIQAVQAAE